MPQMKKGMTGVGPSKPAKTNDNKVRPAPSKAAWEASELKKRSTEFRIPACLPNPFARRSKPYNKSEKIRQKIKERLEQIQRMRLVDPDNSFGNIIQANHALKLLRAVEMYINDLARVLKEKKRRKRNIRIGEKFAVVQVAAGITAAVLFAMPFLLPIGAVTLQLALGITTATGGVVGGAATTLIGDLDNDDEKKIKPTVAGFLNEAEGKVGAVEATKVSVIPQAKEGGQVVATAAGQGPLYASVVSGVGAIGMIGLGTKTLLNVETVAKNLEHITNERAKQIWEDAKAQISKWNPTDDPLPETDSNNVWDAWYKNLNNFQGILSKHFRHVESKDTRDRVRAAEQEIDILLAECETLHNESKKSYKEDWEGFKKDALPELTKVEKNKFDTSLIPKWMVNERERTKELIKEVGNKWNDILKQDNNKDGKGKRVALGDSNPLLLLHRNDEVQHLYITCYVAGELQGFAKATVQGFAKATVIKKLEEEEGKHQEDQHHHQQQQQLQQYLQLESHFVYRCNSMMSRDDVFQRLCHQLYNRGNKSIQVNSKIKTEKFMIDTMDFIKKYINKPDSRHSVRITSNAHHKEPYEKFKEGFKYWNRVAKRKCKQSKEEIRTCKQNLSIVQPIFQKIDEEYKKAKNRDMGTLLIPNPLSDPENPEIISVYNSLNELIGFTKVVFLEYNGQCYLFLEWPFVIKGWVSVGYSEMIMEILCDKIKDAINDNKDIKFNNPLHPESFGNMSIPKNYDSELYDICKQTKLYLKDYLERECGVHI